MSILTYNIVSSFVVCFVLGFLIAFSKIKLLKVLSFILFPILLAFYRHSLVTGGWPKLFENGVLRDYVTSPWVLLFVSPPAVAGYFGMGVGFYMVFIIKDIFRN